MEDVTFERKSVVSGIIRSKTFKVDPLKYQYWKDGRMMVQDAFSHLSAADREFIISGATEEEWDELFKEEL